MFDVIKLENLSKKELKIISLLLSKFIELSKKYKNLYIEKFYDSSYFEKNKGWYLYTNKNISICSRTGESIFYHIVADKRLKTERDSYYTREYIFKTFEDALLFKIHIEKEINKGDFGEYCFIH